METDVSVPIVGFVEMETKVGFVGIDSLVVGISSWDYSVELAEIVELAGIAAWRATVELEIVVLDLV